MQAHDERKNFAEKYYPQVWRFLSKTRRACPCAVGDVRSLLILPAGVEISQQNPQGLSLRSGRCANFAK